jgi:hypothetical protein
VSADHRLIKRQLSWRVLCSRSHRVLLDVWSQLYLCVCPCLASVLQLAVLWMALKRSFGAFYWQAEELDPEFAAALAATEDAFNIPRAGTCIYV